MKVNGPWSYFDHMQYENELEQQLATLQAENERLVKALEEVIDNLWRDHESQLYVAVKKAKALLASIQKRKPNPSSPDNAAPDTGRDR